MSRYHLSYGTFFQYFFFPFSFISWALYWLSNMHESSLLNLRNKIGKGNYCLMTVKLSNSRQNLLLFRFLQFVSISSDHFLPEIRSRQFLLVHSTRNFLHTTFRDCWNDLWIKRIFRILFFIIIYIIFKLSSLK